MEDNNMILEQSNFEGNYQMRLKMKYLEEEKQKLEISCRQMKQNIEILRTINKQLSKGLNSENAFHKTIKTLNKQVQHLQSSYIRVMNQNEQLNCLNLMHEQIMQESKKENYQILKSYENKIVQLRRSIQFKQSCIQSYEQNYRNFFNNNYQMNNIPPSNVSIIFYNQIDEYRKKIDSLERQNKQLKKKNQKVIEMEKELITVKNLLTSSTGYLTLKETLKQTDFLGNLKKCSSQSFLSPEFQTVKNKPNPIPKQLKQKQKGNFPQQTRQTLYHSNHYNNSTSVLELKKYIMGQYQKLQKISVKLQQEKSKRKECQTKLKAVVSSNLFYKQKRQILVSQLNYYKNATIDFVDLLEKKKVKRKRHSLEKNSVQDYCSQLRKPQQIALVSEKKEYWKKVQKELHTMLKRKKNIILSKKPKKKVKRSLSDILNYTSLEKQEYKVQKYYQGNYGFKGNKQTQQRKERRSFEENPNQDYSYFLGMGVNGECLSDQTFIIKPKTMNYAERKKIKSKINDAHNLTIIRQNVL